MRGKSSGKVALSLFGDMEAIGKLVQSRLLQHHHRSHQELKDVEVDGGDEEELGRVKSPVLETNVEAFSIVTSLDVSNTHSPTVWLEDIAIITSPSFAKRTLPKSCDGDPSAQFVASLQFALPTPSQVRSSGTTKA